LVDAHAWCATGGSAAAVFDVRRSCEIPKYHPATAPADEMRRELEGLMRGVVR
jgi:hypothetical protein